MNEIRWGVWTRTSTEAKSRRVVAVVLDHLGREVSDFEITEYPKTGGHRVYFTTPSRGSAWPERVLDVIQTGLRVGRGWILSGDAEHELNGWSNDAAIPGVVSVSWDLVNTPES